MPVAAVFRVVLCALVLAVCLATHAYAGVRQGSTSKQFFWSPTLGEEVGYRVYLPPGYDPDGDERYPVIYLLHGLAGSSWDWFHIGHMNDVLDGRARGQRDHRVIAVAPNGGSSYWTRQIDRVDGAGRDYGRFVAVDLIAEIDQRYRTLRRRKYRALVGLSMGGFGALSVGFLYPDRFATVVSLSGALFTSAPNYKKAYRVVWGDPPDAAFFDRSNPYALVTALPKGHPWPHVIVSCGRGDHVSYRKRSVSMHELLTKSGVSHEYVTGEGGHSWKFWTGSSRIWLDTVLQFGAAEPVTIGGQ